MTHINLIKINNLEIKKIVDHINKIKPSIIIDFASICMVNESWKFSNHYKNVNYFHCHKFSSHDEHEFH